MAALELAYRLRSAAWEELCLWKEAQEYWDQLQHRRALEKPPKYAPISWPKDWQLRCPARPTLCLTLTLS
jgi:hypothetical protein